MANGTNNCLRRYQRATSICWSRPSNRSPSGFENEKPTADRTVLLPESVSRPLVALISGSK